MSTEKGFTINKTAGQGVSDVDAFNRGDVALTGDYGDDGKPVMVVGPGADSARLQQALIASGLEERVVVLRANDPVPDLSHLKEVDQQARHSAFGARRPRNMGAMLSLAVMAAATAALGGGSPLTGRSRSQRLSSALKDQREHLAELRANGMRPEFAALYGKPNEKINGTTQQDLDRLAAAQAKRDRRAAKKGSK